MVFACCVALLAGCEGSPKPLATTMCHARRVLTSDAGGEHVLTQPTDAEWIALLTDDEEGVASSCELALAHMVSREPLCAQSGAAPRSPRAAIAPRIAARLHREGQDDVIWIATHMTRDGMHVGVMAIVRRTSFGLEVQAMGAYTGPADNAELRLLRVGSTNIVSVEAERGHDRVAHLLIQSGGSLIPTVIEGASEDRCGATAEIVLRHIEESPRPDGWTVRVVRTATLEERPDVLLVREHLTVHELDRRNPDERIRARHDADAIRRLVPVGGRLRSDRAPLDVNEIVRR